MSREEFMNAVETLYGSKYDCSCVTEQNLACETNFSIKCERHGTFCTTPYQLLHGLIGGCLECHKEDNWGKNMNGGLL